MQPIEPAGEETSLELTFPDRKPDTAQTGTSLELPLSEPPPQPAVEPEPAAGPLGDLVAAHFRRVENAMLGRVLIATLAGALPCAMVTVERRRSLGKRLSGRPGEPIGITVTSGERAMTFRSPEVGVAEASIGHVVHGVVLSSSRVSVPEFLDELGVLLDHVTDDDEATRVALERALLRA